MRCVVPFDVLHMPLVYCRYAAAAVAAHAKGTSCKPVIDVI
jgi:hypothetical protein